MSVKKNMMKSSENFVRNFDGNSLMAKKMANNHFKLYTGIEIIHMKNMCNMSHKREFIKQNLSFKNRVKKYRIYVVGVWVLQLLS